MRIIFFLLMSIITLSGCENNDNSNNGQDDIWDIYPVIVSVSVIDSQGKDMLDPQTPNSFDLSKIKAIYKEQEYVCNQTPDNARSKAYMPHFYGLTSRFSTHYNTNILYFGELSGAKSYTNETITIVWSDASSDEIKFNRAFQWNSDGSPDVKQEWFLNNTKVSDSYIKIIK